MAMQAGDQGEWVIEACAIVADWEAATQRPLLMITEASDLAERIARALIDAYDRGKHDALVTAGEPAANPPAGEPGHTDHTRAARRRGAWVGQRSR